MSGSEIDLLIIGAGPAGCSAAVQFKRLGGRPVLLDRDGRAGGLVANAFRVENYPGTERPLRGLELAERLGRHLDRFGLGVETGVVTSVRPVERRVKEPPPSISDWHPDGEQLGEPGESQRSGFRVTGDFGEMQARSVVIACGTVPSKAAIPGESLPGARLFYEVNDLLPFLPRTAAVVGGGEAALDYALTLADSGTRVSVLVRGQTLRASGRLVDMVGKEPRITVMTGTPVHELQKPSSSRVDVLIPGRRLSVDGVLLAVGRRSAADAMMPPPPPPLPGRGPGGSAAVRPPSRAPSPSCLTSIPGLFIAGDARLGGLGQAGIAVGDGLWCAAAAAAFLSGDAVGSGSPVSARE
ncbi:MAG: NAD(P)/FAD-dependent oxidoreductase [Deltaproteobacteria bacterium]|nr:NAD(P)/FAD-dependent oxidoreductase [Deltaproteobacteria bacterium]